MWTNESARVEELRRWLTVVVTAQPTHSFYWWCAHSLPSAYVDICRVEIWHSLLDFDLNIFHNLSITFYVDLRWNDIQMDVWFFMYTYVCMDGILASQNRFPCIHHRWLRVKYWFLWYLRVVCFCIHFLCSPWISYKVNFTYFRFDILHCARLRDRDSTSAQLGIFKRWKMKIARAYTPISVW